MSEVRRETNLHHCKPHKLNRRRGSIRQYDISVAGVRKKLLQLTCLVEATEVIVVAQMPVSDEDLRNVVTTAAGEFHQFGPELHLAPVYGDFFEVVNARLFQNRHRHVAVGTPAPGVDGQLG